MRIIIKYTLKSMAEKKLRAFLIILAIALSGALFLASSRLSDGIVKMYYDMMTAAYGDADIDIYPGEDAKEYYASISGLNKYSDYIERVIPQDSAGAEYKPAGAEKSQRISIQAYNIQDYLAINELKVIEGNPEDCQFADMIVSEYGAKALGVSVGQEINLRINGGMRKVKIVAIVGDKGIFKGEEQGGWVVALMPFDTVSKYNKSNNRASEIHVNVKKGMDIDEVIEMLQNVFPDWEVGRTVNVEEIEGQLASITQPFMLMTLIVIFMSIFIIYSSFKVIMLEKLPMVGTFRSVGATKWIMNGVLLLEGLFYGIIGGIVACGLGVGCLYVLSYLMVSGMMGGDGEVTLSVPLSSYLITFGMGVGMALISTLFPILGVSKISLKDVILNNRPHKQRRYLRSTIIGVALMVLGFELAVNGKGSFALVASVLGMFIVIIGIIKVLPIFVLIMSKGLGIIFKLLFGNIGELATKNIKKNKSVLNSITLITIGISILFSISTMTRNVSSQILDFYKDTYKCDIMGYVWELDSQKTRIIKRIPDVENVVEAIQSSFKVPEFKDMYLNTEAIKATQLTPDIQYNLQGDEKALLEELQTSRNVIITEYLKNKFHVKVGDYITLNFKKNPKQYKVIGFMKTQWRGGQFGLLPSKYVKRDAKKTAFDMAYITLKPGVPQQQGCAEIEQELQRVTGCSMRAMEDLIKSDQEGSATMMMMISIFAILAMVMGIVGVINNLLISFIERKQSIAMFRSIGMSKFQVLKMIFIEGLGSGVIGAVGGLLGGILVSADMNYILKAMEQMITIKLIPEMFISYFIGGMLITVIGSIIPARGGSKLNIIEAIKYE